VLDAVRRGAVPEGIDAPALAGSCEVSAREISLAYNAGGLAKLEDLAAATALFGGAVRADPSHHAARFNFVSVAAQAGRASVAVANLVELAHGDDAARWLGRTLLDPDFANLLATPAYWELMARAPTAEAAPGAAAEVRQVGGVSFQTLAPAAPVTPAPDIAPPPSFDARAGRLVAIPGGLDPHRVLLAARAPAATVFLPGHTLTLASLEDRAAEVPAFRRLGARALEGGPAWWFPAPDVVLLLVPYHHRDSHNMTGGFALFEPAPGGFRELHREALPSRLGITNEERVRAFFSLDGGTALGWLDGNTGTRVDLCRLRHAAGALRRICTFVEVPSIWD
jgi:hypothetical protein